MSILGSTFIHAPDEASLLDLVADEYAIERFKHIDLDVLITLDFVQLIPESLDWCAAEPVVFDEEGGMAVARVQPDAITFLLDHEATLSLDDLQRADIARIRAFVAEHGLDAIYEFSTF